MDSPPVVRQQSYGKSQVRLSWIHRKGTRHDFIELTTWIELVGQFHAAYGAADNSLVVATDTIKNAVYVLAKQHGVASIEAFAQLLGRHFLESYAQVERIHVRCAETSWARMSFAGQDHSHAFVGGSSERFTCTLDATRDGELLNSGFKDLQVLKTNGSGFSGFFRDLHTTLRETEDRIFATSIEATWPCQDLTADWSGARRTIRQACLDAFANQYSKSAQHTLYEMARSAFDACPLIDSIEITMPNQHHLLANLSPFGLDNPNEVFVPTSEPFGKIRAMVDRAKSEKTA
jgi:urate oxidase